MQEHNRHESDLVRKLAESERSVAYLANFIRDQLAVWQEKARALEVVIARNGTSSALTDDDIKTAYERYDSDPRVHGPDDFEAFRDAIDPGDASPRMRDLMRM